MPSDNMDTTMVELWLVNCGQTKGVGSYTLSNKGHRQMETVAREHLKGVQFQTCFAANPFCTIQAAQSILEVVEQYGVEPVICSAFSPFWTNDLFPDQPKWDALLDQIVQEHSDRDQVSLEDIDRVASDRIQIAGRLFMSSITNLTIITAVLAKQQGLDRPVMLAIVQSPLAELFAAEWDIQTNLLNPGDAVRALVEVSLRRDQIRVADLTLQTI